MNICCLMQVWNSKTWLPYSIEGIYDFADSIVINESCWVPGDWVGETSPDGTAEIVKQFILEKDHSKKVLFNSSGFKKPQHIARNKGMHLVPSNTDWIMMVDCDEFYMPSDLVKLRKIIEETKESHIGIPAKCFYFDFSLFKREGFQRIWKWFPEQRFHLIASMINRDGTVRNIDSSELEMFHYSYVGPDHINLKGCAGEDVSMQKYLDWRDNVYNKFDGTNLAEIYSKNNGGVHVFGGGSLENYFGDHPPVLDSHPLRHLSYREIYEQHKSNN